MPKLPRRFSLATLLLAATIVCLIAAIWSQSKQLQQVKVHLKDAEDRVDEYRNELGYLTITDPNKLHVIRVPSAGPEMKWQWRIYVPEANRFKLNATKCVLTGKRVERGFDGSKFLAKGETTLDVSVARNPSGVRIFQVEQVGYSGTGIGLVGDDVKWLDESSSLTMHTTGYRKTEAVDAGKPITLLRVVPQVCTDEAKEAEETSGESIVKEPLEDRFPGLMVWITDSKRRVREASAASSGADMEKMTASDDSPSR